MNYLTLHQYSFLRKVQLKMGMTTDQIIAHYSSVWGSLPAIKQWDRGPVTELPAAFRVLEFMPSASRDAWTYATCGMAQQADAKPIELFLLSPQKSELHVELLTAIAHFHRTSRALDIGATVNFGRPWLEKSMCSFGLISLPYLDGPQLEELKCEGCEKVVRCLWLIPITQAERDFKSKHGLEAIENRFEDVGFNYLDPLRRSVV